MGDFSSALHKLEFEKIVRRITQLASTEPGKSSCRAINPQTDAVSVAMELVRVTQMKELLIAEGSLPLDGLKDITAILRKTGIENQVLTPLDLLDVGAALRVSRTMQGFFSRRKDRILSLHDLLPGLYSNKVIEFNIDQAIDETGRVRDSSSKELRVIRQDMASLSDQLRKRLGSIVRQVAEKDLLQEDIVTTRDGRFVIPVKTEFKHRVPGFIHSASGSGATVFVEPAETLELNNSLRELQFREQREIERILKTLTQQVAEIRQPLEQSVDALGVVDLLAAKARYSIEIIGNAPKIVETPTIDLKDVRHPLLLLAHPRESVVPLSLLLRRPTTSLLITGPNAGGKSVALKTVGLCVLCAQSGIHLPSSPDSQLSVFRSVFVDIGDDQSVENDLSTFSSHLMNMKDVLENASGDSLVLIDEIGTGTDPSEGAALASSVLQELLSRQCLTIATTHHGTLKAFAHETEGMENGSMEFNQQTLSPTYRFRYGVPGSSYALELAQRIGLQKQLLDHAREFVGSDKWKLESLIGQLEKDAQEYRDQLSMLARERDKCGSLVKEYETKLGDVRKEIKNLKKEASAEAQRLIDDAQASIERLVREIRERSADSESIRGARRVLEGLRQDAEQSIPNEPANEEASLVVGDRVTLVEGTETGEIVAIRGESATVLWKHGRMKAKLSDLRRKEGDVPDQSTSSAPIKTDATNELDLRGLTGEEAISQVQNFLDDAFVSGLHRVDIIHGKGTGALRKRVSAFLKGYPHIKSFRLGEWNEGGAGVTVVELAD